MKDSNFLEGITVCDSFDKNARASISVDFKKYEDFLENSDMSDADKAAFLEALWSIIVSFVDQGFGVHPLQQVDEISENSSPDSLKHVFSEALENDAPPMVTQDNIFEDLEPT